MKQAGSATFIFNSVYSDLSKCYSNRHLCRWKKLSVGWKNKITETLGVSKLVTLYILKKKQHAGELGMLRKHKRKLKEIIAVCFLWKKKHCLTSFRWVKNTLLQVHHYRYLGLHSRDAIITVNKDPMEITANFRLGLVKKNEICSRSFCQEKNNTIKTRPKNVLWCFLIVSR